VEFRCPELRDAPGTGGYALYVGDVRGAQAYRAQPGDPVVVH